MTEMLHYVWLGILSVFQGPAILEIAGVGLPIALVMLVAGLITGIAVGATPGLAGPMAMAISLPLLISAFGFTPDALLPVFGFLIGIMKGATLGGALPAILFNLPGTPDAMMTTLDGFPMAQQGQPRRALRIAQLSSVAGDTFSDLVLFICAPFLAVVVEAYLDLPEKTALLILSISFVAAVMGRSVGKGLLSVSLGLLVAYIATGNDLSPRLTLGFDVLQSGIPLIAAVLGVLGWAMRKLAVPVLPFVIAFILAGPIERSAREAFAASGADPWFLFSSPTSVILLLLALAALMFLGRER